MKRYNLTHLTKTLLAFALLLLAANGSYSQHTKKPAKKVKTASPAKTDTAEMSPPEVQGDVDVREEERPTPRSGNKAADDSTEDMYYKIRDLLETDKNEQALVLLRQNKERMKEGYAVDYMVAQAEMAIAFKNKDYNKYLLLALAEEKRDPRAYMVYFNVASAYASIYATTGQDTARASALQYIARHKTMFAERDDAAAGYINQIEYRLYTRDIIDDKTFRKKYPKGWKRK